MKKVATLILNRNLPKVTDKLFDHINKYDGKFTDIFVIEAGSDKENLSDQILLGMLIGQKQKEMDCVTPEE